MATDNRLFYGNEDGKKLETAKSERNRPKSQERCS